MQVIGFHMEITIIFLFKNKIKLELSRRALRNIYIKIEGNMASTFFMEN